MPLKSIQNKHNASLIVFLFLFLVFTDLSVAQSKIFLDVGEARVRKSKLAMPRLNYLGAPSSQNTESSGNELFSEVGRVSEDTVLDLEEALVGYTLTGSN